MTGPSKVPCWPTRFVVAILARQASASAVSPPKALPSTIDPVTVLVPSAETPPGPTPWSFIGEEMMRFSK